MTVLSKPGSIGLSIAGVDDPFKIIANVLMMADRLFGDTTSDEDIARSLSKHSLDMSPDNIAKVRAYFN